jgi:hypothetical protein
MTSDAYVPKVPAGNSDDSHVVESQHPEVSPEPTELEEAESDMLAAGFIVDILQDELENARKYQRECRDKYIALCDKTAVVQ